MSAHHKQKLKRENKFSSFEVNNENKISGITRGSIRRILCRSIRLQRKVSKLPGSKLVVIKGLVPEAIEFLLFTLENTYFPASA